MKVHQNILHLKTNNDAVKIKYNDSTQFQNYVKRVYIYFCIISIKFNSLATKNFTFLFFNYQITKETKASVKKMFKIKYETGDA